MENNPSQIGIINELQLLAKFAENGCTVFFPFGGNTKIDIIIEYRNKLYKIQCKHSSIFYEDGELSYAVFKTHWKRRDGTKVAYSKEEIDFFATMIAGEAYLIPIEETTSSEKRIRFLPPKNGQIKGITFAKDYTMQEVLKRL